VSEPAVTVALGPCFVHGGIFAFDPDRVPTVLIDPVTERPVDVDEHGNRFEPSAGALARVRKAPYCPVCARALNVMREEQGLPPFFDETDTAEALRG
jgi:hypothetical protein